MPSTALEALLPSELDPATFYTVTLADDTRIFVAVEMEIMAILTTTGHEGISHQRLTESIRVGDPVHSLSVERGIAEIPVASIAAKPLVSISDDGVKTWEAVPR